MKILTNDERCMVTKAGTTLVEVLMSMLVMAIGVVAVATLFPAAVLRSIQATQLTNATILSLNAQSLIRSAQSTQDIVRDPQLDGDTVAHLDENYFVDPWGASVIGGNIGPIRRYNAGVTIERVAQDMVTLPDSWVSFAMSDAVSNITANSIDIPNPPDLTGLEVDEDRNRNGVLDTGEDQDGDGVLDSVPSRVILVDGTGKRSVVREIRNVSGQKLSWSASETLPIGFTPASARIEVYEPRYSWLLTVRNSSRGTVSVDVVVFFRRSFSAADEGLFQARYQGNGKYSVTVPGNKPFWKRGGYLFDSSNARWHRVQQVNEAVGEVVVEGNPNQLTGPTSVMFPRGVMEVYPLGL